MARLLDRGTQALDCLDVRLRDDLAQRVLGLGLGVADDDKPVQAEPGAVGAPDLGRVLRQLGGLSAPPGLGARGLSGA
jgi:hypothetical protein